MHLRSLFAIASFCTPLMFGADLTVMYSLTNPSSKKPLKNSIQSNSFFQLERMDSEEFSGAILFDYEKDIIHSIDYKTKSSTQIKLDDLQKDLDDWDKGMDALGAQAKQLKADPTCVTDLKVDEMGEQIILGRKCKHIKFHARGVSAEVWFDETLKPTAPRVKMVKFQRAFQAAQLGMLYQKTPIFGAVIRVYGEMANLDGTILRSVISLPPGRIGGRMDYTTEAISLSSDPLPPNTFALPNETKRTAQQPIVSSESVPKIKNPTDSLPINIIGTVWGGTDSDNYYYEYNFQPNGVLQCVSSREIWKNVTWKIIGDQIYIHTEAPDGLWELQGKINGTHMQGTRRNKAGVTLVWVADKK